MSRVRSISNQLQRSSLAMLRLSDEEMGAEVIGRLLEEFPDEWVVKPSKERMGALGEVTRECGFNWMDANDFRVVMATMSLSGVIEHSDGAIRRGRTPINILSKSLRAQLMGIHGEV